MRTTDELDNILLNAAKFYWLTFKGKKTKLSFDDIDFKEMGEQGIPSNNQKYAEGVRALGFMEAILVTLGVLDPGEKLKYDVREWRFLWIFKGTHKQSWNSFIFNKTTEYLEERGKM